MKLDKLLFAALLACAPGIVAAQQSSQSAQTGQTSQAQPSDKKPDDAVADAARRTKDQKKDQPKAAKVWDNDNIPSKPDAITVLGEPDSATDGVDQKAAVAPNTTPQDTKAAEADAKEKAAVLSELTAAKEQLQSLNTDLDILTRKNALDQQSYYGQTNYASDKQGAAKMKDEQDQIDAKKQEIAETQKKIDELTEKLNRSPSETKTPANPQ